MTVNNNIGDFSELKWKFRGLRYLTFELKDDCMCSVYEARNHFTSDLINCAACFLFRLYVFLRSRPPWDVVQFDGQRRRCCRHFVAKHWIDIEKSTRNNNRWFKVTCRWRLLERERSRYSRLSASPVSQEPLPNALGKKVFGEDNFDNAQGKLSLLFPLSFKDRRIQSMHKSISISSSTNKRTAGLIRRREQRSQ